MKKMMIALVALMMTMVSNVNAMSYEQARQQALFLTDKMAYELNLTEQQYEAAYEINLDYLMSVNTQADLYGPYWSHRNMDLSYVLFDWQYRAFCAASYFYRPLYWDAGYWHFGIYSRYPHRDYFYFGRPHFWTTYRGGHSWHMNGGRSWYHGRNWGHSRPQPQHHGMRDGFKRGDYRNGFGGSRGGNHGGRGGVTPGRDNRGGNHGGRGGVTPGRDNRGGNHGGRDGVTPGRDNRGGNFGGRDGVTPGRDNRGGNFGGRDGVTPGRDNRGGNSGMRPGTGRGSSTRTTGPQGSRPSDRGSMNRGGGSSRPSGTFTPRSGGFGSSHSASPSSGGHSSGSRHSSGGGHSSGGHSSGGHSGGGHSGGGHSGGFGGRR